MTKDRIATSKEDHEMLNILADALLLVTRFGPLPGKTAHLAEADPRDATAQRQAMTSRRVK
jgi:hypothetical protein